MNMNDNDKPDDIVTNICASNTWFPLMKYLLFWHDMNFLIERVVDEGSENRSSTPPLYLNIGGILSNHLNLNYGTF